jgi:phytoene dehydrogenase-like protein
VTKETYDVAIIGAGPNGLTAGAYLARAGASVLLLERRFERGGTFATDDYSTPFQYNIAQFQLPLGRELPPYRDLALEEEGVAFVEPELPFSAKTEPGGPELAIGRGGRGLGERVEAMLRATSEAVLPLLYLPAGDAAAAIGEGPDPGGADELSRMTPRKLTAAADDPRAGVILRYACGLAGFLDGEAPLGSMGAFAVARLFEPAIVVGGTKNLANALYRVSVTAGARALVNTEVVNVAGERGSFVLRSADDREFAARNVLSTLDPRSTFLELLDGALVPSELREAAAAGQLDPTGPLTGHFGVKGAPPDPAEQGRDALIRVFGFSGPDEVESRFADAIIGQLGARPAGHLTVVTAHDPLQASPGPFGPLHTLRAQAVVPWEHPDGGWDAHRLSYRDSLWEELLDQFPSLGASQSLFRFCDTPLDIERRFATARRGSIRQGALVPDQTFDRRPHPSCSGGRTPTEGIFLGGGAVHPGLPGSLGGGYNAAATVARDLGLTAP